MGDKKYQIDVTTLFSVFERHLKIENNSKILFSGKFGIGKTYFLNRFFESNQEYNVFHLFPVNYQISQNEDIIKYLKHDILVEMLNRNELFDPDDNLDRSFIDFIKSEWKTSSVLKKVIENTVEILPSPFAKLGKPLKTLLEIDEKFQEFKTGGEKKEIENFLKENNTEVDLIGEIIKKKLTKLKPSILVLDDLDRIDPEHIFRILNVFSAHFDLHSNLLNNKLGFDKIVIVGDYNNLKSIFHHRYGIDTDSNGYFDKFFSIEVFEFDNSDLISKTVDEIVSQFKIEDTKNLQGAMSNDGYTRIFLEEILKRAVNLTGKERLNLRQLLKGMEFPLSAFMTGQYQQRFSHSRNEALPQLINISIKALISIFGGSRGELITLLNKIKKEIDSQETISDRVYLVYAKYLIKKLKVNPEHVEEGTFYWNEYEFIMKNGEIEEVKRHSSKASAASVFYDALIEYVDKKKHLESVEIW